MLKEKLCHSNTVVESSVHHWSPAILRGDSNHDTNDDVIKYLGTLGTLLPFVQVIHLRLSSGGSSPLQYVQL